MGFLTMHFYKFNIADYQSHTKHLTPIEDICYRRMLDWIYLNERPLPKNIDTVCRLLSLIEYKTDVERVLKEFLKKNKDGWNNVRCILEIQEYKEKQNKASLAGKAGVIARKNKIKQELSNDIDF